MRKQHKMKEQVEQELADKVIILDDLTKLLEQKEQLILNGKGMFTRGQFSAKTNKNKKTFSSEPLFGPKSKSKQSRSSITQAALDQPLLGSASSNEEPFLGPEKKTFNMRDGKNRKTDKKSSKSSKKKSREKQEEDEFGDLGLSNVSYQPVLFDN